MKSVTDGSMFHHQHLGHLTPSGEAFHDVLRDLSRWGLAHARDRLTADDLKSWPADVANAQTRGHQRVAGASRGHPLRILWRFQEPNGIAHHVADSRTDRRRHMLQGSRICRRSDRSQRCCYPCQALSRARELAGGRWKSIVDRGRSKNGATASNLAAASQTTRPGLSTFWPSCCLSSTAESFCASHK